MSEVFKIQNISLGSVALIDFGLIIPPNEIVELENFDQTLLSPQLDTLLNDGTLVRLINDVSVPYNQAYSTTIQVYNFDSSSVDASINLLFRQDITINASLGLRPLTTYVDGSLNLKVNQSLFDTSISSIVNKNLTQDASIILKADKSYVDASISIFATNASIGIAGFLKSVDLNPYATNASIGIAAFAKNASLGLYATNASIGLAGFITSSALTPYATNASVGLALGAYTTNVSSNLAFSNRDSSILVLRNTDITINASLGIRPLTTYVDGSLNLKVNKTLFDSSIAAITLKDINQDTSIAGAYTSINSRIYGNEYQLAQDLSLSSTTSTSPQAKVTMTTSDLPSGTYKIVAHWMWNRNSTANSARFDITLNGATQGTTGTMEMEAGDVTDWRPETRIFYWLLSGTNTITFRYWGESVGNSTSVSDATIELIRVK